MTDPDIITQADEACPAPYYDENGIMRDEPWRRIFERCDLLPRLLAEAKRLKENNEYLQEMIDEAHGIMDETQLALAYEVGRADAWKAKAVACFVVAMTNQRNEMERDFWNTDNSRWKGDELTLEKAAKEVMDSVKCHLSEEYGEKQEAIDIASSELAKEMR